MTPKQKRAGAYNWDLARLHSASTTLGQLLRRYGYHDGRFNTMSLGDVVTGLHNAIKESRDTGKPWPR